MLHLYSLMGGSDVAEVPGADVLFRSVALRGWWLNVWLASLSQQQLRAALQARAMRMASDLMRRVADPPSCSCCRAPHRHVNAWHLSAQKLACVVQAKAHSRLDARPCHSNANSG